MVGTVGRILRAKGAGWLLPVWVQPRARKDSVVGVVDGRLKLRIAAPAVENKANAALMTYVAGRLGLRRHQVELISGATGRKKTLRIVADREPEWERLTPAGMSEHA